MSCFPNLTLVKAAAAAIALSGAAFALQSCATTASRPMASDVPAASAGAAGANSSSSVRAAGVSTKSTSSTSGASAATLRLARSAGYEPEERNGVTMYCKTDANIGTLFKSKKCVDEDTLKIMMQQRADQQDILRSLQCSGGCGGK